MNKLNTFAHTEELANLDLVVFSHLRWEFVTQRPQHLVNRIGPGRKVLFVEEPIPSEPGDTSSYKLIKASKNITILQPKIKANNWTFELVPVVQEYLNKNGFNNCIFWFYSADFLPVLALDHEITVYDCMDELSAFKGAPKALIEKEKYLLKNSDIVFTGGKSLYESKSKLSDNVHCFPSSVDKKHFESALKKKGLPPHDIRHLKKPIVGYYGVIDERIDMPLIQQMANEAPEVDFVMIGPVVKISEDEIARANNIHYLGGKKYEDLPMYLREFDVAMMPFALNESTKFISPTKTLEYMAANKPIISTAIYDVVRDYSNVVKIVNDSASFVKEINYYLSENKSQKAQREKMQKAIIEKTSWDNTAQSMKKLIAQTYRNICSSYNVYGSPAANLAYE